MLSKYYLNDYFPLIDSPLLKEREYMKTDIKMNTVLNSILYISNQFRCLVQ